jgi:hypothetical protein
VIVVGFRSSADLQLSAGNSVEIRGVVTKDLKLNFNEGNKFDGDFDFSSFEQMLDYYHNMCGHLTVSS